MGEILMLKRCAWALASQQYLDYHDKEWGVPVHDDRKLFEMLLLEGMQAVGMVNDHIVECFRWQEVQLSAR